jgi:Sec-independent protein translocase protein TatA
MESTEIKGEKKMERQLRQWNAWIKIFKKARAGKPHKDTNKELNDEPTKHDEEEEADTLNSEHTP